MLLNYAVLLLHHLREADLPELKFAKEVLIARYLERGAVVKAPGSFKLSSSISEAQRDTLTRIQFKTAAYLRRLAQPLRCFV